jgi:hypothetical protein
MKRQFIFFTRPYGKLTNLIIDPAKKRNIHKFLRTGNMQSCIPESSEII